MVHWWTIIYDAGPSLNQYWINVWIFLGYLWYSDDYVKYLWWLTGLTGALIYQTFNDKHETLIQCWFNVGPASETVGQHLINIGSASGVCGESERSARMLTRQVTGASGTPWPHQKLLFNPDCLKWLFCIYLRLMHKSSTAVQ